MKNNPVIIISVLLIVLSSFAEMATPGVSQTDTTSSSTSSSFDDGLMDSAWPMFHHDVRHTGRSPYGPDQAGNWAVVKWKHYLNDYGGAYSSPAIDDDGVLYLGQNDNYFLSIYPNGTEKWRFDVGYWVQSSPALGADGTIYFGSDTGSLYALNPDGTLKWRLGLAGGWVFSSPAIDTDGIIYVGNTGIPGSPGLTAVYPNGTIKWKFNTSSYVYSSPAIDEDRGVIYIGAHDRTLYAIYKNGTLKWKHIVDGEIKSPPSIGDDGTIYFCSWDAYLYAVNPNGTRKWRVYTNGAAESSPAIALDGTIYTGSLSGKILSISPTGNKNWEYQTNDDIYSSPIIDKNGVIYCGSNDRYLYALNPNGTLRWKIRTGQVSSTPAINKEGIIYVVGGYDLYALDVIENQPPATPSITGPSSGAAWKNYDYTIASTDPDDDKLYYYVDWGDETNTGWIGPYESGDEVVVSHRWMKRNTYTVQVKAKDTYDRESDWTTLEVTMPKNKAIYVNHPILNWLFERLPNLFPILHYFFNI